MPVEYRDRVADTSTTTGTGTLTLAGSAPAGYRTFALGHTTGATVRYSIASADNSQWEVGEGVWTTSGATLTRETVFASSNAGSLVSFSAGTKAVSTVMTAADVASLSPDSRLALPNAADDEFDFGTSVDTAGVRRSSASAWSWVNQSTSTGNLAQGHLVFAAPSAGSDNTRALVQSVSGSSWKFRAKLTTFHSANANYFAAGLILRDSSGGKLLTFYKQGGSTTFAVGVHRWASATSFNASAISGVDIFSGAYGRSAKAPIYLEIELAAGTLTFRYSDSGADGTFVSIGTESVATYISVIDQIGVAIFGANGNPITAVFDWFRRVA